MISIQRSWLTVVVIIGTAETVVSLLLWPTATHLGPLPQAIVHAMLLSACAAPSIWLVVARPLQRQSVQFADAYNEAEECLRHLFDHTTLSEI